MTTEILINSHGAPLQNRFTLPPNVTVVFDTAENEVSTSLSLTDTLQRLASHRASEGGHRVLPNTQIQDYTLSFDGTNMGIYHVSSSGQLLPDPQVTAGLVTTLEAVIERYRYLGQNIVLYGMFCRGDSEGEFAAVAAEADADGISYHGYQSGGADWVRNSHLYQRKAEKYYRRYLRLVGRSK
jgi:hypothetical protein